MYRSLETTLLDEICSRLNLAEQLNEVTVQDIRALRSHGISLEEIERAIQRITGISDKKLTELLDDVVERNQKYYSDLIDLAKVTAPKTLVSAADVDAIRRQTEETFRNLTRSMGFLVDNGRTMLPPAKAYQWALDNAEMQVMSGAVSYNQAIKSAVKQLADSGLRMVDYESGHRDQIDVAGTSGGNDGGVPALRQVHGNKVRSIWKHHILRYPPTSGRGIPALVGRIIRRGRAEFTLSGPGTSTRAFMRCAALDMWTAWRVQTVGISEPPLWTA